MTSEQVPGLAAAMKNMAPALAIFHFGIRKK
jgi:hypothetical protein